MDAFAIVPGSTLAHVLDTVAAILFRAGSFLVMVAGIGIARFPDLLARMHAATKPQSLGLAMLMTALALEIRTGNVIWTLLLVVMFQLFTAPVSAHMVGRAGYRTRRVREDLLRIDELTVDLDAINAEREARDAELEAEAVRRANEDEAVRRADDETVRDS